MENNENNHNAVQLQQFLEEYATPSEVKIIAFEYSHKAFRLIEDGVPPVESILKLVDYCQRRNELLKLAPIIEKHFPEQYHELNLNFDTPPKRTSKPRRAKQTPPAIVPNETHEVHVSSSSWLLVLKFIVPAVFIVLIILGYCYTIFLRPDLWPESWVTPFTGPFHLFFIFILLCCLVLPYGFWLHDNLRRINLNNAQPRDFKATGIANTWAHIIIEERKRLGRFQSVEQAKAVLTDGRSHSAKQNLDDFYRVGWLQFNYGKYAQMAMNFLGGELEKLWNGKSTKKRR